MLDTIAQHSSARAHDGDVDECMVTSETWYKARATTLQCNIASSRPRSATSHAHDNTTILYRLTTLGARRELLETMGAGASCDLGELDGGAWHTEATPGLLEILGSGRNVRDNILEIVSLFIAANKKSKYKVKSNKPRVH